MNKTIDEQSFIDCEAIDENSATYNFNTKVLKQGKKYVAKAKKPHWIYSCK